MLQLQVRMKMRAVLTPEQFEQVKTTVANGTYWNQAHRQILECFAAFQLLHLIRLGLLGVAATYLWLSLPALLFTSPDDLTSRWMRQGALGLLSSYANRPYLSVSGRSC